MVDKAQLRGVIATQLGLDDFDGMNDETRIGADLDADSLDVVELVCALEEEFKVEIADAEWETLGMDPTVGEVRAFLEARGV